MKEKDTRVGIGSIIISEQASMHVFAVQYTVLPLIGRLILAPVSVLVEGYVAACMCCAHVCPDQQIG